MTTTAPARKVLIIVHQAHSTPGRVGELLEQRGCVLDRRCPNLGDPLPSDLSPYAASVLFGGPQSANDDHLPGIRAELEWLERNRWLTLGGTFGTGTLVLLAPMLLVTELMVLAYASTRGTAFLRAKLRAARWVLSHGSDLRRLRRAHAPLRSVTDLQVLSTLRWSYDWSQSCL